VTVDTQAVDSVWRGHEGYADTLHNVIIVLCLVNCMCPSIFLLLVLMCRSSKVQRPTRHRVGHFRDDIFAGWMTQLAVSKHWRRVVSHPDRPQSNQAHLTTYAHIIQDKQWKHKQINVRKSKEILSTVSKPGEMMPNLIDQTSELLKWLCNYRQLHNTVVLKIILKLKINKIFLLEICWSSGDWCRHHVRPTERTFTRSVSERSLLDHREVC